MTNLPKKLIHILRAIKLEVERYERSPVRVIINWFNAFLKDLFSAREIRLYGLADPQDGAKLIQHYVSKEMADRFYRKANPESAILSIDDKFVFTSLCLQQHLSTPKTYGIFRRGEITKLNGEVFHDFNGFKNFMHELEPGEYLLKPNNGMLGLGLSSIEIENQDNLIFEGEVVSLDDFYQKLRLLESTLPASSKGDSVDMDFEGLIFQQRIDNHPEIRKLTGFRMLQTVRICTYVTEENQIEILFAFMKLAGKEGLADAFNLGKTGNMLAKVDPETGKFCKTYAMDLQQGYFIPVARHAITQMDLMGFIVPYWQETRILAKNLALSFLPLRAVGWDIAITDKGPVVLEGNGNWVPVVPFDISIEKLRQYKLKY